MLCLGDLFPSPPASTSTATTTEVPEDGQASSDDADQETKDLVEGRLAVPVPTYFMLGERKLPSIVQAKVDKDAGEVTENLSYLGQSLILDITHRLLAGTSSHATAPHPSSMILLQRKLYT